MAWLQSADSALFRLVNLDLSNSFLDQVMPFFSGNRMFMPAVVVLAIGLLWKGGLRGRVMVAMLILLIASGDALVINTLKHLIGRVRPYDAGVFDARLLAGRGGIGSMPSSHTSTWFAGALIAFVYYRRSWRFMLPLACLVGLSRIYVGVHYPSDVLAGAILGAGYAAGGLLLLEGLWSWAGARWFPVWHHACPSLLLINQSNTQPGVHPVPADPAMVQRQWLRLGYFVIAALLVTRLFYIASGTIELSEDEAYQWLWSKHLAWSYYSKPLMIALLHFLGTSIWGDTEFGVRFFSPVIAAVLHLIVLRFLAKTASAASGFVVVVLSSLAPLLAVGATLITVDPPLVLFWTAGMIAGWRAIQDDSTMADWLLAGLWVGLGFLSKYTAALQLGCWAIFFLLWPPARAHLRRRGPYLALFVFATCTLPVLIWNWQHDWISFRHVVFDNAARQSAWSLSDAIRYFPEFLGAQAALLNPVLFIASIGAAIAFWRRYRRDPLLLWLFSMGAPVFAGYLCFSFYKRVLPNWTAPAVLPMFCLMAVYWSRRAAERPGLVRGGILAAALIGALMVIPLHNTDVLNKVVHRKLPPKIDPLRRVRAWSETGEAVAAARQGLSAEGRPVCVIAGHYGLVSELSFYIPGSRARAGSEPSVFCSSNPKPRNQFYFWPGYLDLPKGYNAIYVCDIELRRLKKGWWMPWLRGETNLLQAGPIPVSTPAPDVMKAFATVSDLGVIEIPWHRDGRVYRRLQIFACRNLHGSRATLK